MARIWNAPIDDLTDTPSGPSCGAPRVDSSAPDSATGRPIARRAAPDQPMDVSHAPAVRAFLADRQDGLFEHQKSLARAVLMARRIC